VKKFLNQFSVPNKDLKKIKKQLTDSFSTLKDSELIENEFSLSYINFLEIYSNSEWFLTFILEGFLNFLKKVF
jgi:hypothetical protein